MMGQGLQVPAPSLVAPAPVTYAGGMVRMESAANVMQRQAADAQAAHAASKESEQVVNNLSAYVGRCWEKAKMAKLPIEQQMLKAVRARRGEYDPDKLGKIREGGGSEIYMMLFSTKARQLKALLADVLIGPGTDKPWTITPTAKPDIPPNLVEEVAAGVSQQVAQAEALGAPMAMDEIRTLLRDARDRLETQVMEIAKERAGRMETKMEDQLQEGGWLDAMDQLLDDLTMFKSVFLKGPVVRRRTTMKWVPDDVGGFRLEVGEELRPEWERVDPFMIYPAGWSRGVNDAYLIERHKLSKESLESMIGVEGYKEDEIRKVLELYGDQGLHEWMQIDSARDIAEGRTTIQGHQTSDLIDAAQFWGPVSGKMLLDWGMSADKIPDPAKVYEAEVWKVGGYVIKAVLNTDPLKRRPYFSTGFQRIPGAFWHTSLFDVIEDVCAMCNSAARALANNLGIASGPQVAVNVERLPIGAVVSELHPWKIHQFTSDPMGSTAPAIDFFQPQSNAQELMAVYERFSVMADEQSGIPRYMVGDSSAGGAGRTASGLSMMVGNAQKTVQALVSNLDIHVVGKSVERQYHYNMRYVDDPELKGDVNVVARGALSLMVKEQAQVRRAEFLARTANPFDMQIMGAEGRAYVLRETARSLDMDTDKVVPSLSMMRAREAMALAAQQGMVQQPGGNGQSLMNGAPVTDQFSPTPG